MCILNSELRSVLNRQVIISSTPQRWSQSGCDVVIVIEDEVTITRTSRLYKYSTRASMVESCPSIGGLTETRNPSRIAIRRIIDRDPSTATATAMRRPPCTTVGRHHTPTSSERTRRNPNTSSGCPASSTRSWISDSQYLTSESEAPRHIQFYRATTCGVIRTRPKICGLRN